MNARFGEEIVDSEQASAKARYYEFHWRARNSISVKSLTRVRHLIQRMARKIRDDAKTVTDEVMFELKSN